MMNTTTTPPQFPTVPGQVRELSCEKQNMNLDLEMPQIPEDLFEDNRGHETADASSDHREGAAIQEGSDQNKSDRKDKRDEFPEAVPVLTDANQTIETSEISSEPGVSGSDTSESIAEQTGTGHTDTDTDQAKSSLPEAERTEPASPEQNQKPQTVPSEKSGDNQETGSLGDTHSVPGDGSYTLRPGKGDFQDDSLKSSDSDRKVQTPSVENQQDVTAAEQAEKDSDEKKENSQKGTSVSESVKEQISGPVIQVLQKDKRLQIILRKDVDPALSILKWNSKKVESEFLDLDSSTRNHLTYELRNSAGDVLESSEQFFEGDNDLREDPEKQPQVIRNQLGIYQSLNYSIPDQSQKKNLKVTLDGVPADPSDIRISRSNRLLRSEYLNEWNETVVEEIEIRPLGQIEQDLNNPAAMVIENGVMKITLNGNWQGMSLVMKSADLQETWLPFESGCLQIRLDQGQSYQFSLSHALLHEQISWKIEAGSWTDESSSKKPGSDDKNQQESFQTPAGNSPSAPGPSAPAVSEKPAAATETGQITTVISNEESSSVQLAKPLEQMKFEFSIDGITLSDRQIFRLNENPQEKVRVENGTIASTAYSNSLTAQAYSTLDEAIKANPQGSIEVSFRVEDLWGNTQESSYSLIPPVTEASGTLEMNTGGILNRFALDENGNLNQEALEFASRPGMICKGLAEADGQKILTGDEIRIYLTIPEEEALIRVNHEELHDPEFKTDELGLRYVSLNADQELDIEVHSTRTRQKITATIQPEPLAGREIKLEFSAFASPVQGLLHTVIGLLSGLLLEGKRRFGWPL